ncbi:MAG: hypothetical protein J07HQW2_02448 [Haloquadratum walsbyi J07HQW2]|uniref:Uncharacterized protein n=1 Tax=Haloquadratum walsbyi J07HQW2 TaxID=1238425 RepID=U1PQF4_9EURY|nr:MAG: hypothetical protein J07HQW2_02448 [Haloquadratum walsbyi J07HQW2]
MHAEIHEVIDSILLSPTLPIKYTDRMIHKKAYSPQLSRVCAPIHSLKMLNLLL